MKNFISYVVLVLFFVFMSIILMIPILNVFIVIRAFNLGKQDRSVREFLDIDF